MAESRQGRSSLMSLGGVEIVELWFEELCLMFRCFQLAKTLHDAVSIHCHRSNLKERHSYCFIAFWILESIYAGYTWYIPLKIIQGIFFNT